MANFRRRPVLNRDLSHVDTKRRSRRPETREIGSDHAPQHPPLAPVNRLETLHTRMCGARAHLDKHDRLSVAADQVDLLAPVAGIAPIPRHNPVAQLPAEK